MIEQGWAFIQAQLATNNFLSGGAVLMVLGGAAALLRKLPYQIWDWFVHRIFIKVEIPIRDDAFLWFDEWMAQQPYGRTRARWLSVRTVRRGRREDSPPTIILSPAPGVHWLLWHGYFLIVHRERQEPEGKSERGPSKGVEYFKVSVLTRKRPVILKLLEEARDAAMPKDDPRITVYTPGWHGEWDGEAKRRLRPLESVVLRDGVMERIVARVKKFMDDAQRYIDLGIPYRYGCLLHGAPGGGKSSIVIAIASHLGLDIAMLNLSDPKVGDAELRKLLGEVPEDCVVLIEDIDCAFTQREASKDKENRLTFSGLLNAIDGVAAGEGRVLFMTSNHPEVLDPALIRAGRCDDHELIENACAGQATRMFKRFFPTCTDADAPARFGQWSTDGRPVSMADIQGHLTKHGSDWQAAITNVPDIFTRSFNEPQTTDAAT